MANEPCPDCGSSDGLQTYDDHTHCFVCKKTKFHDNDTPPWEKSMSNTTVVPENIEGSKSGPLMDRSISKEVAQFYGVRVTLDGPTIGKHHYPYYDTEGKLIAWKHRSCKDKKFYTDGKLNTLFGMNKFPAGGKYITITEGECDAMACREMLGNWPFVSVPGAGAHKKVFRDSKIYDYVNSFENIIISFDNDDVGRQAAQDVSEIFPGKAKVMKLTEFKDANDYLEAGKFEEFKKAWWGAELITPDGIVSGEELLNKIKERKQVQCIPSPWDGLDELTYGFRFGEMWTLTSGSGMGKTQILREMEHHLLSTTEYNIGGLFLEETAADSGLGLMSINCSKPLHLPDVHYTEEEFNEAAKNTILSGRVYYFDSFGENSIDKVINRINYMVKVLDCRFIFLDHISILVSEQTNGDERKALDEIATKLKKMTINLDCMLIMVSHSKRPTGKPHEEGGQTSLSELRGTAGIGQLSNMVLGFERNGQAEDKKERNTTTIRVLKNRFSGLTGPACKLLYDNNTGRLSELDWSNEDATDD